MSYEEFEAQIVAIAHQDLEMCAVFIVKEMIFFTIHPEPVAQGALPLVPHPAVLEQQAALPGGRLPLQPTFPQAALNVHHTPLRTIEPTTSVESAGVQDQNLPPHSQVDGAEKAQASSEAPKPETRQWNISAMEELMKSGYNTDSRHQYIATRATKQTVQRQRRPTTQVPQQSNVAHQDRSKQPQVSLTQPPYHPHANDTQVFAMSNPQRPGRMPNSRVQPPRDANHGVAPQQQAPMPAAQPQSESVHGSKAQPSQPRTRGKGKRKLGEANLNVDDNTVKTVAKRTKQSRSNPTPPTSEPATKDEVKTNVKSQSIPSFAGPPARVDQVLALAPQVTATVPTQNTPAHHPSGQTGSFNANIYGQQEKTVRAPNKPITVNPALLQPPSYPSPIMASDIDILRQGETHMPATATPDTVANSQHVAKSSVTSIIPRSVPAGSGLLSAPKASAQPTPVSFNAIPDEMNDTLESLSTEEHSDIPGDNVAPPAIASTEQSTAAPNPTANTLGAPASGATATSTIPSSGSDTQRNWMAEALQDTTYPVNDELLYYCNFSDPFGEQFEIRDEDFDFFDL